MADYIIRVDPCNPWHLCSMCS